MLDGDMDVGVEWWLRWGVTAGGTLVEGARPGRAADSPAAGGGGPVAGPETLDAGWRPKGQSVWLAKMPQRRDAYGRVGSLGLRTCWEWPVHKSHLLSGSPPATRLKGVPCVAACITSA